MHKRNSTTAGASRDIGVNVGTMIAARRTSGPEPLIRSIYRRARRWMAGRRPGIQVVAVQRGDYSIIT